MTEDTVFETKLCGKGGCCPKLVIYSEKQSVTISDDHGNTILIGTDHLDSLVNEYERFKNGKS